MRAVSGRAVRGARGGVSSCGGKSLSTGLGRTRPPSALRNAVMPCVRLKPTRLGTFRARVGTRIARRGAGRVGARGAVGTGVIITSIKAGMGRVSNFSAPKRVVAILESGATLSGGIIKGGPVIDTLGAGGTVWRSTAICRAAGAGFLVSASRARLITRRGQARVGRASRGTPIAVIKAPNTAPLAGI